MERGLSSPPQRRLFCTARPPPKETNRFLKKRAGSCATTSILQRRAQSAGRSRGDLFLYRTMSAPFLKRKRQMVPILVPLRCLSSFQFFGSGRYLRPLFSSVIPCIYCTRRIQFQFARPPHEAALDKKVIITPSTRVQLEGQCFLFSARIILCHRSQLLDAAAYVTRRSEMSAADHPGPAIVLFQLARLFDSRSLGTNRASVAFRREFFLLKMFFPRR